MNVFPNEFNYAKLNNEDPKSYDYPTFEYDMMNSFSVEMPKYYNSKKAIFKINIVTQNDREFNKIKDFFLDNKTKPFKFYYHLENDKEYIVRFIGDKLENERKNDDIHIFKFVMREV